MLFYLLFFLICISWITNSTAASRNSWCPHVHWVSMVQSGLKTSRYYRSQIWIIFYYKGIVLRYRVSQVRGEFRPWTSVLWILPPICVTIVWLCLPYICGYLLSRPRKDPVPPLRCNRPQSCTTASLTGVYCVGIIEWLRFSRETVEGRVGRPLNAAVIASLLNVNRYCTSMRRA